MRCSGIGRDPSRNKVFRHVFFKVELTIILNGFLNIRLSFARSECNADVPLENAQNMRSVWMAWFQFWHKQQHLLIDILFFCSILNEQCIQWIQIDSLKTNIKMQWHISSSHLSCATDKAAWQTPQIRMQRFVGWMWIFILYSTNIHNSEKIKIN